VQTTDQSSRPADGKKCSDVTPIVPLIPESWVLFWIRLR
jgi:hypothetical protein